MKPYICPQCGGQVNRATTLRMMTFAVMGKGAKNDRGVRILTKTARSRRWLAEGCGNLASCG